MFNIHQKIEAVEYAIQQYRNGNPIKYFCDESVLIEVCEHFIENYHRSMKMSAQDRILEQCYRTDVDF